MPNDTDLSQNLHFAMITSPYVFKIVNLFFKRLYKILTLTYNVYFNMIADIYQFCKCYAICLKNIFQTISRLTIFLYICNIKNIASAIINIIFKPKEELNYDHRRS